jgi:hypothetical protein
MVSAAPANIPSKRDAISGLIVYGSAASRGSQEKSVCVPMLAEQPLGHLAPTVILADYRYGCIHVKSKMDSD